MTGVDRRSDIPAREPLEVFAISRLGEPMSKAGELLAVDETLPVGDLLKTGDLQPGVLIGELLKRGDLIRP